MTKEQLILRKQWGRKFRKHLTELREENGGVGISPDLLALEDGGLLSLEDGSGFVALESTPPPVFKARQPNIQLSGISPAFQIIGAFDNADLGASLQWDDITPPNMQYISTISSEAGGVLVYAVGGNTDGSDYDPAFGTVNQLTMVAGKEYFVAFPLANTFILDSGEDWQGNDVTNTVTDLIFKGI